MVVILYQKDFVKRGDLRFCILFPNGYFENWIVLWECIYVYTNRHVKIVYELKVRAVHRTTGISGIWILTRMGALTHTGTCTVYVRTVYCTEDRITRPRKIKTRGRRNRSAQARHFRTGVFRRLSSQ